MSENTPVKPTFCGTASVPIRVLSGDAVLVDAELSVPIAATVKRQGDDPLKVEVDTCAPELESALASFFAALADEFRSDKS